jgi:hypothetical protein
MIVLHCITSFFRQKIADAPFYTNLLKIIDTVKKALLRSLQRK